MKAQVEQSKSLRVKEGDVVTFDVLEWDEGWEFGGPCVMLRPVIRVNDNHGAETIIENACIDGCCEGEIKDRSEWDEDGKHWRGWTLKTLNRRFAEALRGKRFPKACYRATRKTVKFVKQKDGSLLWEDVPNGQG